MTDIDQSPKLGVEVFPTRVSHARPRAGRGVEWHANDGAKIDDLRKGLWSDYKRHVEVRGLEEKEEVKKRDQAAVTASLQVDDVDDIEGRSAETRLLEHEGGAFRA